MASLKKAEPKDIQQWKILEIVKKLCLYTGLSSFTVLMAVFNSVTSAITHNSLSKLDNFTYFTMVQMRLRFHANNADIAFRFGISEPLYLECF